MLRFACRSRSFVCGGSTTEERRAAMGGAPCAVAHTGDGDERWREEGVVVNEFASLSPSFMKYVLPVIPFSAAATTGRRWRRWQQRQGDRRLGKWSCAAGKRQGKPGRSLSVYNFSLFVFHEKLYRSYLSNISFSWISLRIFCISFLSLDYFA
jgi:hypothetical protein